MSGPSFTEDEVATLLVAMSQVEPERGMRAPWDTLPSADTAHEMTLAGARVAHKRRIRVKLKALQAFLRGQK